MACISASRGITRLGKADGIWDESPTTPTAIDAIWTTSVETTNAMGNENCVALVRSTPTMSAMVSSDTRTVGTLSDRGWRIVSTSRATLFSNALEYPVRSADCDNTMLTATPVRNPRMTEFETKRTSVPARSSPRTI